MGERTCKLQASDFARLRLPTYAERANADLLSSKPPIKISRDLNKPHWSGFWRETEQSSHLNPMQMPPRKPEKPIRTSRHW